MAEKAKSNQGHIFNCIKVKDWEDHFNKEKDTKRLVVVAFTAKWCGPCRIIAPTLKNLAEEKTNVVFLEVNVDDLREVADEYKVEEMPTFAFFENGKEVKSRVEGALPKELRGALNNV